MDRPLGLRLVNLAEGADPEAHAYLSELLDLHQSFDWAAAGPYLARRVGGEDEEAARAFVHCDKRLVDGHIGLQESLGDTSNPYAAGVTATPAPPESGWGACPRGQYPRTNASVHGERPSDPCSWGRRPEDHPGWAIPRGPGGPPDVCPARGTVLLGPGGGAKPQLGVCYAPVCARLGDHLSECGRDASGGPRGGDICISEGHPGLGYMGRADRTTGIPVNPLGGGRAVLVETKPEATGYQMASRLEGYGQRVAPGSAATAPGGGSTQAPHAGEPAAAGAPYYGGGYSHSAGGTSAASQAPYTGVYSSLEAGLIRAPRSTLGPVLTGRGPTHENPFDPPVRVHHGGYARDDLPLSPARG